MDDRRRDVVLDSVGAIELLTLDREDGVAFLREVYGPYWCDMAEHWLFLALVVSDALRTLDGDSRDEKLAAMRGLARGPGEADYDA